MHVDWDEELDEDLEEGYVSQPKLVGVILMELVRQGFKEANSRQYNAVIKAADQILAEFGKPHIEAKQCKSLNEWLASDDTGLSSCYLAGVLSGQFFRQNEYPCDPADFGRCVRLLDCCPELRENLHYLEVSEHGPVWNAYYKRWAEMEALYREEYPTGKAPKLYALMQEIQKQVRQQ